MNDVINSTMISGAVRVYQTRRSCQAYSKGHNVVHRLNGDRLRLRGRIWTPNGPWQHNDPMYDWGTVAQNLFRGEPDGKPYKVAGMYIEFDNSGSDVDPIPVVAREESLSYYDALNSNFPNRDYLRVPLIASEGDTSDAVNFPQNNMARFFAQTAGTLGVHGLTYADTSNSVVYGGGLAVYPDNGDTSQDLIFSRWYLQPALQVGKVVGSQIGISWELTFN